VAAVFNASKMQVAQQEPMAWPSPEHFGRLSVPLHPFFLAVFVNLSAHLNLVKPGLCLLVVHMSQVFKQFVIVFVSVRQRVLWFALRALSARLDLEGAMGQQFPVSVDPVHVLHTSVHASLLVIPSLCFKQVSQHASFSSGLESQVPESGASVAQVLDLSEHLMLS